MRGLRNVLLAVLGPVTAVAVGLYVFLAGGRYVSTDNAYVKADKIAVSSEISGRVIEVLVKADQSVTPGTLLFRLDPLPHVIALDQAEARLAATLRDAAALQALYRQKVARLAAARGDATYYGQLHDRQQQLGRKGVVSQSGLDVAEKNSRNARDQIAIIEQEIAEVRARLGGDPDQAIEQQPSVREAQANRERAALDKARTQVRAAVGGTVTNFDLQPGEHVDAGRVVFSLIGSDHVWLQANFKETDLTHVQIGQSASVYVDTYPDTELTAEVASISPATGAEFALLPPQNATGNWVKVVQRLPVRLHLRAVPGQPTLRAGMSVVVTIDTERRRPLPKWARGLLGWAVAAPRGDGPPLGGDRSARSGAPVK